MDNPIRLDDTDKAILRLCGDKENLRGPIYDFIAKELGYNTKGAISNRMQRLRELGCLTENNVTISMRPQVKKNA